MKDDLSRLTDSLEDVLDRERAMLLSGSLDGLARIAEEKEHLLGGIASAGALPGLQRIRRKAERNAVLLNAAGAGLKSVSRRLAEVGSGPKPLSTYRADGRREDLGQAAGRVEKRA